MSRSPPNRDRLPPGPGAAAPTPSDSEPGRALLIVAARADRWGVVHGPVPRMTVWAEADLVP
ncbi:hypothetical protein [Streptomyces sp. CB03234]|uniref:hypothetical protein n=1 Tax=Streptomyces sp. (strain CB03234) TaxID=1703937 RepID=UPI00093E5DC1